MGAFDPLFRNRSSRFGRRAAPRHGSKLGALSLAGIGYGIYRFLKTEKGQEMQNNVIARIRELGGRISSANEQLHEKLDGKRSRSSIPEMSQL